MKKAPANFPKDSFLVKVLAGFLAWLVSTSFCMDESARLFLPDEVSVVQSCAGDEAEISFKLQTTSEKPITIYSFDLGIPGATFYCDDKPIATSGVALSEKYPITIKVKFTITGTEQPKITFRSNLPKYSFNEINVNYGALAVSIDDIRTGKELAVNITESCVDSIRVVLPYGGTESGARVFKTIGTTLSQFARISYGLGDNDNYFMISKSDTGCYYAAFGSCHWGGGFYLDIK